MEGLTYDMITTVVLPRIGRRDAERGGGGGGYLESRACVCRNVRLRALRRRGKGEAAGKWDSFWGSALILLLFDEENGRKHAESMDSLPTEQALRL